MNIKLIAAAADDWSIANNGKIPWNISEDRKFFAKMTSGDAVLMGRLTQETLKRRLPGRLNLVLSRTDKMWWARTLLDRGFVPCNDADHIVKKIEPWGYKTLWIAGGAQIYKVFVDQCTEAFITRVKGFTGGDTKMPNLRSEGWHLEEVEVREEFNIERWERCI